jgi:hypothetical protein
MMKIIAAILLLLLGIVSQFGAIVSWFKGHDHSAIGWMLLGSISLGYGLMLAQSASKSLRR